MATAASPTPANGSQEPDESLTPDAIAPGPMHAAIDHAADVAASASQLLQEGLASAREAVDRCVDEACTLGAECTATARSAVRTRPLTAVLGALAVGMLIGRLCR